MKRNYENPELLVHEFTVEDIVTTSGFSTGDGENGGAGDED